MPFILTYDLFFHNNSFIKKTGWLRSYWRGVPLNNYGENIPWYNYAFIHFIEERLNNDMIVYEYGCGNSTLWWSKRVKYVYSIENDSYWFNKISSQIPFNVQIELKKDIDSYTQNIKKYEMVYDIIIIDGKFRYECFINSIKYLKNDGVLIWDNSDREECSIAKKSLYDVGFKELKFISIGPLSNSEWSTSVFYKSQNCLGI